MFLLIQAAREIRDYFFNYCTQNDNIEPEELEDLLSDIIDEEFDTICEDNSAKGMSTIKNYLLKFCIVFSVSTFQNS